MKADSVLDHHVITESYFFPRPGEPSSYQDYIAADGTVLRCHWQRSDRATKTLVHFHGNGEIVTDYLSDYADAIAELGVNILFVEYRGYGGSGGVPQLGKMLDDVRAVREQCGLVPAETILYGRSVGAIFAVEWANQEPEVAGLILESGVASPIQRLLLRMSPEDLGVDLATLEQIADERLNHRKKLSRFAGELLILHAAKDTLVGPEHAHWHHDWAPTTKKRLVLFPHGDHNSVMSVNWSAYLGELKELVTRLM